MVKPSRACLSLVLLAWGGRPCRRSFPVPSSSFATAALVTTVLRSPRRHHNHNNRMMMATVSSFEPDATSSSSSILVASNLQLVRQTMEKACATHNNDNTTTQVRLVAVSKTKPASLVLEAYAAGHRIFGENYVQELVQKATELPNDISWHFIGPLQSNKAALLVKSVVPQCAGLTVETVATLKLANKLNRAMEELGCLESGDSDTTQTLSVFVQVNTSGEESKSGVAPQNVLELVKGIRDNCPRLQVQGLMTIGAPGDLTCFDTLRDCRDKVGETLGMSGLELSMGMSGDYVDAIARGSTNVRVGSTIFGERDYSQNK